MTVVNVMWAGIWISVSLLRTSMELVTRTEKQQLPCFVLHYCTHCYGHAKTHAQLKFQGLGPKLGSPFKTEDAEEADIKSKAEMPSIHMFSMSLQNKCFNVLSLKQ